MRKALLLCALCLSFSAQSWALDSADSSSRQEQPPNSINWELTRQGLSKVWLGLQTIGSSTTAIDAYFWSEYERLRNERTDFELEKKDLASEKERLNQDKQNSAARDQALTSREEDLKKRSEDLESRRKNLESTVSGLELRANIMTGVTVTFGVAGLIYIGGRIVGVW